MKNKTTNSDPSFLKGLKEYINQKQMQIAIGKAEKEQQSEQQLNQLLLKTEDLIFLQFLISKNLLTLTFQHKKIWECLIMNIDNLCLSKEFIKTGTDING